jgi:hypothetical protein
VIEGVRLEGVDDVLRAMRRLSEAIAPQGQSDIAVRAAGLEVLRYSSSITHRLTGALSVSHMMELPRPGMAVITPDPSAINPLGHRPAIYGPIEEARGGSHAFYRRTLDEDLARIGEVSARALFERIR